MALPGEDFRPEKGEGQWELPLRFIVPQIGKVTIVGHYPECKDGEKEFLQYLRSKNLEI